jgi:hypothetical protein
MHARRHLARSSYRSMKTHWKQLAGGVVRFVCSAVAILLLAREPSFRSPQPPADTSLVVTGVLVSGPGSTNEGNL